LSANSEILEQHFGLTQSSQANRSICVVRFTTYVRQQQRVGIEFCAKTQEQTRTEIPDVMQDSHLGEET